MRIWLAGLAALTFGGAVAAAPALEIRIAPAAADTQGHVPWLDVSVRAEGISAKAGAHFLRLPVTANTVPTSADDIGAVIISDAAGAVAATTRDAQEDDSNRTRQWLAPRDLQGAVTVRYRVPIEAAKPLLNLPQYELRTGDGAFSGAGNAFLILPDDKVERTTTVRWDLSAMAPGSVGVSSLGVGDATSHRPFPSERIAATYYAAGKVGVFRGEEGFFAAFTGQPPFDTDAVLRWAGKLHGFYGQFFREMPPSFGVFGRPNPQNPGSGIGLTDSFAFTFGPKSTPEELKGLLAHEMLHAWVNSLDGSMDQAGGLSRSWFGEGLAVNYQRMLPWRAGLIDDAAFLADLNETAGRY